MAAYSCPEHGWWRPPHPPKQTTCNTCWAYYGRWKYLQDQKTKVVSKGRAKGGGQSSKQKGRNAVVLVADMVRKAFALEPDDVLVKATSQGGCDIHLSPAAAKHFPFSIEVKCQEALPIWQALQQAEANARPGRPPVLFFKRAHTRLYVALHATDFLLLLPHGQNPQE